MFIFQKIGSSLFFARKREYMHHNHVVFQMPTLYHLPTPKIQINKKQNNKTKQNKKSMIASENSHCQYLIICVTVEHSFSEPHHLQYVFLAFYT